MESTTGVIARVVQGDRRALDQLLSIIHSHHMGRETRRYRGRNRLIDDDDIESHFLEGCFKACSAVRLDVGNPLLYILWKGRMEVATLFRKRLSHGVQARCMTCRSTGQLHLRSNKPLCRICGSLDIKTWQTVVTAADREKEDDQKASIQTLALDDIDIERDLWFSKATYRVQIDEMRRRLRGRVLDLFDLLILEGINAQTSQNYLKEIADRWGCSGPTVAVYLRKVRAEVLRYYEEA